ncbi:peptidylprolyl isomerase [Puniceibacterium sp. IMCC21224]|uniref:peptidylprolyl isomerase n=1 Tax=Puniceibacterium sp. IMCC21224 TaxID=1618204 RepID=UPI00065D00B8|nr:peptidylprolyl isomerase [Puniceibacterium sp. IMCC21224]KMK67602.1 periplasmic chaperone for outer membrane proteins SurA [Puniceibacterium sp. IMCC21224]
MQHQMTRPPFRSLPRLCAVVLGAFFVLALPVGSRAQGLFAPAITVNDAVITGFELEQRALMLKLLNAPGDPSTLAREQLIDDRLRVQAAKAAGLVPAEEEVLDGMTEFASRAQLSREEFVESLGASGVAEQTFRDFVIAGVAWRQLVQARFGPRVRINEAEIDRALSSGGSGAGSVRVLLSEIIMPAPPPEAEAVRARAQQIAQYTTEAEFSAAARKYSATASRGAGGRLPWQNLSDLPPVLQPLVLGLAPGKVTAPLPIPDAVALFQLRGIEETGYTAPEITAVEYAAYYMPGGRSSDTLARARVLAGKVDRCDDLYGAAKGQPEEVLERGSKAPADIPTDIAIELSKLDPGEVSTALTRANGQTLVFLMLCGRSTAISADASREDLAIGLRNRQLGSQADSYLAALRADARITER